MARRLRRHRPLSMVPYPERLRRAREAFVVAREHVEEAKEALVSTVRSGRVQGAPLAQGLLGFEAGLEAARGAMPAWRTEEVETEWRACDGGLAEAARRAERFRLGASPKIYEELIGAVEGLLDPLEPFEPAERRFRKIGPR